MSLRTRQPRATRIATKGQRMAPGGRRWSEAPIPRVATRRVRNAPGPVLPAYWWKFDEASGNFVDSIGGVLSYDMSAVLSAGYQSPPLAPGSTYSVKLWDAVDADIIYTEAYEEAFGLDYGPDGLIVFDFWVDGIETQESPAEFECWAIYNYPHGAAPYGYFWMSSDDAGATIEFGLNANTSQVVLTGGEVVGPTHVRWEVSSAGESRIYVDDSLVSSQTYTVAWDTAGSWITSVGRLTGTGDESQATWFDEFKIFATKVPL